MENNDIIQNIYELLKDCDEVIGHMPSDKKYGIGRQIETCCFVILDKSIKAKYINKSSKKEMLFDPLTKLDMLRLLIRLCMENRIIKDEKCFKLQEKIDVVGRMLGGWYRSL